MSPLDRPGAVAAAPPDEGAPAHYGEPMIESRALEDHRAVVDLPHWDVVAVSGPDRLTWLHSITSQHLATLEPGASTELLVLDPHGRIEHAAAVVEDGATTWLITEDGAGLAGYLDSMRFAMRVEVDRRDDLAVLGTSAHTTDLPDLALRWNDVWPVTAPGGSRYGPPDHEHPGAAWQASLQVVPRDRVPVAPPEPLTWAGVWAWEAQRVATGRPRLRREVDARAIPHELDWLRTAVHLDKGCYRGQETIARVFTLGRPPRRLVLLHLDGSEHTLPEPGEAIRDGQKQVGALTTIARHHELGPIALALVKRSTDPSATLLAGEVSAAQEVLVGAQGYGTGRPPPRDAPRPNPALRRR